MQVNINNLPVGYDDFGQGPAVLFIHDFPLNRKMWRKQVEPLVSAGFRVVLIDLRGFGETVEGDSPVEIQTYSSDIIGLLNFLGIGRAVMCGLSFGGYILFDLMERYPHRIAGACLAASRPVTDDIQERAKRAELGLALLDGKVDVVKTELFRMIFSGQEENVSTDIMTEVKGWLQSAESASISSGMCAIAQRKDYTFLLKGLEIPTLLIGAEQDPITYHKHTEIMAQQLPNCYRSVNLRSGHLVNLERADEFNAHLLDFLQNLAPRRIFQEQPLPLQSVV